MNTLYQLLNTEEGDMTVLGEYDSLDDALDDTMQRVKDAALGTGWVEPYGVFLCLVAKETDTPLFNLGSTNQPHNGEFPPSSEVKYVIVQYPQRTNRNGRILAEFDSLNAGLNALRDLLEDAIEDDLTVYYDLLHKKISICDIETFPDREPAVS